MALFYNDRCTRPVQWPGDLLLSSRRRERGEMPEERSADHHCTILIAEDDEGLRESLTALLRSDEHEILQAGDGEDALRVLQGGAVDVLVLDLHMPKLDGAELLGQIDVPPPEVIIYSA